MVLAPYSGRKGHLGELLPDQAVADPCLEATPSKSFTPKPLTNDDEVNSSLQRSAKKERGRQQPPSQLLG